MYRRSIVQRVVLPGHVAARRDTLKPSAPMMVTSGRLRTTAGGTFSALRPKQLGEEELRLILLPPLEATAVQELNRVADELPPGVANSVREGVSVYLKWVQQDDWPGMTSGNGSLRARLPGLADAMKALVDYNAPISGQRSVQVEALAAIGKVRDARRARILQSRAFIGSGQWLVVVVLYFHVLLLIATVHIKRRVSMAVALWMFSSAFAICFVLLLLYDRPFRSGGLTVSPVSIETPVGE